MQEVPAWTSPTIAHKHTQECLGLAEPSTLRKLLEGGGNMGVLKLGEHNNLMESIAKFCGNPVQL